MLRRESNLIRNPQSVINTTIDLKGFGAGNEGDLLLVHPDLVWFVSKTLMYHDLLRGTDSPVDFGNYFYRAGKALAANHYNCVQQEAPFLVIDNRPQGHRVGIVLVQTSTQRVIQLLGSPEDFRRLFIPSRVPAQA